MIEIKKTTVLVSERLSQFGYASISIFFGDEERDGEIMLTEKVSVRVQHEGGLRVVAYSGSGRTEWPTRRVLLSGYGDLLNDIKQALKD